MVVLSPVLSELPGLVFPQREAPEKEKPEEEKPVLPGLELGFHPELGILWHRGHTALPISRFWLGFDALGVGLLVGHN